MLARAEQQPLALAACAGPSRCPAVIEEKSMSNRNLLVFGSVAAIAAWLSACSEAAPAQDVPTVFPAAMPGSTSGTPSQNDLPPLAEPDSAPAAVGTTQPSGEVGAMPVAVAPVTEPAASAPGSDPATMPSPPEIELPVGPEPDAATRSRCTGDNPISCHFGGAPGNYDVTVVLGGSAAATTIVRAETRRTMLGPIATAAGQTRRITFSVNVRQPEGEPVQAVPAGTPGLDLYFVGSDGAAPALQSIGFRSATAATVIYIAGDSTVADQTSVDYGGWGQQLPQYFAFPAVVANYSDSGESSGSFLNSRALFGAFESRLTAKDWVLIQFGHNDKQVAAQAFHDNMTQLVTRVKAKGASPVLVTPVARAQFNGNQVSTQHVNGVEANLPQIIKQVATEQRVPVLDMTARTTDWLRQLGPNGWQAFHALGTDVTHTNDAGASVEAEFVRELMVEVPVQPLVAQLR